MTRKTHIVGNWKMNQNLSEINDFMKEFNSLGVEEKSNCNTWIAPQFIHIPSLLELTKGTNIEIGAQNCSNKESGAMTGDVSPTSLKDLGATFTLVGHSERRAIFNESDETLNEKTLLALKNNLKVIFCVGETLEEREADKTTAVVQQQLDDGLKNIPADKLEDVIIAYEPVWAIGTGKTATPQQAEEVHDFIRKHVCGNGPFNADNLVILYGGSVKPSNVVELLGCENIDGALVGGASLKADDFSKLCFASKA